MNRIIKEKRAHWIGGTATAALGVAMVKLLAPELAGASMAVALWAGYSLVVAGLAIIAGATRRNDADVVLDQHGRAGLGRSGVRARRRSTR